MNEKGQLGSYDRINLREVLSIIKANVAWILLAAIVFGIAGFIYTKVTTTPQYEASINMIVNTRTNVNDTVSNDNINSAKSLVSTYAIIIKLT